MQFEPEMYPVNDYKFEVTSSLGIIAREYEVTQLVQLLQTMGSDSPLYAVLIQSIIDNMNISNREQLIQVIQQASQPNPQAQEAAQAAQQVQLQFQQSQTNALNGQAMESQARAEKIAQETKAIPVELENDRIKAVATNLKAGNEDDKEFERRMKVTDKLLEERRLNLETAKALS
jgi:poly-D-alanine transfer protein DltD